LKLYGRITDNKSSQMPQDVLTEASAVLNRVWTEIHRLAEQGHLPNWLQDNALIEGISRAVNSRTKSYRYVLPTQIVSKLADPSLDCRCLQVARGGPGAFDARTVAHKVVVPFDQANDNVLGGSPEPYVNNPLRVPEISGKYRGAQKNQIDWDYLCTILGAVEERQDVLFTERVFKQVLTEIYRRLSEVHVVYPAPIRISLNKCMGLIERFLAEHSGGDRLLALTSALFVVIGRRFRLYTDIRRASITAADVATGLLADLECVSKQGNIVLAVEVKDRELTISQIRGKIPTIREKQVSEIFFVAQQGISPVDEEDVASLINQEFISGHNVYVTDLFSLSKVVLALLGEQGRRDFLTEVGTQLDKYHSDISHRRAWANLLATI
jgi:hypothetical protein